MSPLVRKDRVWPTIIVTVLVGYVVFGLVAARVASHDPNFAIEPDYYRKAVTWDSALVQAGRSDALGWRLTPALGPIGDGSGALLVFDLRDSVGTPVRDAHVSVEARQVAHADDVIHAVLVARDDNSYAAELPLARSGLWELRVAAVRGTDRFATNIRMDVSATSSARIVVERPGDPLLSRVKAGARREDMSPGARTRLQ